jgi:hypothetical protein
MSVLKISADETAFNQAQTSAQPVADPDSSVVSRVLKADAKVLEVLVGSYGLTESNPGASSTDFWEMGTWDEGHWCNRK